MTNEDIARASVLFSLAGRGTVSKFFYGVRDAVSAAVLLLEDAGLSYHLHRAKRSPVHAVSWPDRFHPGHKSTFVTTRAACRPDKVAQERPYVCIPCINSRTDLRHEFGCLPSPVAPSMHVCCLVDEYIDVSRAIVRWAVGGYKDHPFPDYPRVRHKSPSTPRHFDALWTPRAQLAVEAYKEFVARLPAERIAAMIDVTPERGKGRTVAEGRKIMPFVDIGDAP